MFTRFITVEKTDFLKCIHSQSEHRGGVVLLLLLVAEVIFKTVFGDALQNTAAAFRN